MAHQPVQHIAPYKLLTADELKKLPPPEWLLTDLLTVGGFAVLYGPPGVGKSFLALDLALSVATNATTGFGSPHKTGLVVYIAAEGCGGLQLRLQAWEQTYCAANSIRFLPEAVNLLQELDSKRLMAALQVEENSIQLIVVDTLARCMLGGDENSSETLGKVIAQLDRLRTTFGCAVLLVHHGTKSDEQIERGSSALRGAADTMLCLSSVAHKLVLTCEKQKDAAEFEPIHLRLESVKLSETESSCVLLPASSSNGKLEEHKSELAGILLEKGKCTHSELKKIFMDTAGRSKSTFDRALADLLKHKIVCKDDKGYQLSEE